MMKDQGMMRNETKRRARMIGRITAVLMIPSPALATVFEFDEEGTVTRKSAINYLQRARLAREFDTRNAVNLAQPSLEQKMNSAVALDGSTASSGEGTRAMVTATLPDISMLPSSAITVVNVTTQAKSKRPWRTEAAVIATSHAIPPKLFLALITAESGFDANAVSPKGAIGLTQLMPATAKSLGIDPYDPEQNLIGGARYLRQQFERFGSWPLALAAYNAGPTRVARLGRIPNISETRAFVARVLRDAGLEPSTITTASN